MKKLKKPLFVMLGLVALAAGGAGAAQAVGGGEERKGTEAKGTEASEKAEPNEANEKADGGNLRGSAFERAERAAVQKAGGGKVQEAEKGDDADAAYEVAVRKRDGSVVEYHLDRDFKVIGTEKE